MNASSNLLRSIRSATFLCISSASVPGLRGPVALVGYMHRDLVERKGWISEEDYREGMALAQLAPGPLAAQLGIYIGYVHYGIWGATLAGLAFVLPSFLMVLALGWVYTLLKEFPSCRQYSTASARP